MNQAKVSPVILVAPLDWGLGHATRCIPLIHFLIRQNSRVILAASGKAKHLLQQEFPHLTMLHLPGYRIKYAANAWGMIIKIVAQIPKLLSAIKKEQAWLKKVVLEHQIDAVISDNRYGLHHPDVFSVIITHQLQIKAPFGAIESFLQKAAYRYINQFSACWVPDAEGENNLAGDLSHPTRRPSIPVQYIGSLSRFAGDYYDEQKKQTLLILLSGPEPQRTLLEKKLLHEVNDYTKPVVLVRGLPGNSKRLPVAKHIAVYNHLAATELGDQIAQATMIIGRCGYSTVMDLATLRKKSILIPTPGQTEQEYLSKHLMRKNFALCIEQKKFRLKQALALAEKFPYQINFSVGTNLEEVMKLFLEKIKERSTAASQKSF